MDLMVNGRTCPGDICVDNKHKLFTTYALFDVGTNRLATADYEFDKNYMSGPMDNRTVRDIISGEHQTMEKSHDPFGACIQLELLKNIVDISFPERVNANFASDKTDDYARDTVAWLSTILTRVYIAHETK
ncbi:hypothetical protein O9G_004071 [Rozella allomycis CSF55]|uniref:Uncharacterized protein n=1 Tax=Rozella allomycis (strain CSF55) TaxID=988480 RepID=A0A075B082_ROZAC|nr:hypothetical protein O9G_004071 [Rozella allomycis CSF55]|eukprot:EPZ34194.1 hypothetical protein O9G_004071 [Rozella allomycis CSF55]